ncbi:MAG: helix-turn-helix transcriptional regulator [Rickettsiales bacterium]|nr:helix-turn-helix transcriptional regulator [Rickettsiales bacterium]
MQYSKPNFCALRRQIGFNIKDLRLNKNLSLEELSQRSAVDLLYIHKLERGKYTPELYTLLRLSCGLNVSLKRLFRKTGSFVNK